MRHQSSLRSIIVGVLATTLLTVVVPAAPASADTTVDQSDLAASDSSDAWWADLLEGSGYTEESLLADTGYTPESLDAAIKLHSEETGGGHAFIPPKHSEESIDYLAEALVNGMAGGLISQQQAVESLQANGATAPSAELSQASARISGARASVVLPSLQAYSALTLSMTHRAQTQTWSCGPTAGRMILNTAGITTSSYTGATITAGVLADSSHMNTSALGQTPWSPANFALGLNRAAGGRIHTYYHTTIPDTSAGAASLRSLMVTRLLTYGSAAGLNTQERPGRTYNNHPSPNGVRGHWIAVYGYTADVATARVDDPASGSTALGWSGLSDKFGMSTNGLTKYFENTYGIAA
ncbi:MAG: hypothetical protein LBH48_08575 [Bifidobacteriaceae bacterium]|jgi:hypothetical protein|nr:hypothetical protein [Bifidobacteriaceae bacterium]